MSCGQYDNELGPRWHSQDTRIRVANRFFHADRIRTATPFIGWQSNFNVPIIGREQMFQALRSLGLSAELVIYPGQFLSFSRPSYIHDRLERYEVWYGNICILRRAGRVLASLGLFLSAFAFLRDPLVE